MKSIVILSGGLDSTTALYEACDRVGPGKVEALSFFYRQRHEKELDAARKICADICVPHSVVMLGERSWQAFGSGPLHPGDLMRAGALTGGEPVPHGHYEAPSMKQTVVPNRNMIFIALAVARAVQAGGGEVIYGAHAGDHAIYPDCRADFVSYLAGAIMVGTAGLVRLFAPYIGIKKEDIVRRGTNLRVPYESTWSCYEGGNLHCGKCGTCNERKEAFTKAGVTDPTTYGA